MMDKNARIYVAGHRGMVGSAICRALTSAGYRDLVTAPRADVPLEQAQAVEAFFARTKPTHVFLAAARVGGILANDTQGGDFIRENLQIALHVIDAARRHGAERLLFLSSSCAYPKHAPQPMAEAALLTGPLEPTNLPYAVAKIAGAVMCDAYRRQYGFDAFTAVPSNVYGVGDNFDPEGGHVVAGLMRKFHDAKQRGDSEVALWGSGTAQRELLEADDLGDACVFLMNHYREGGLVNVGSDEEVTIRDLSGLMAEVTGYQGRIVWDKTKPDGTPRKIMDNRRIRALGWKPKHTLREGLKKMYAWFCANTDANTASQQMRGMGRAPPPTDSGRR